MKNVVFSSAGDSNVYKKFTTLGTALPDSPLSRKTNSMISPQDTMRNFKAKQTTQSIQFDQQKNDDVRSHSTATRFSKNQANQKKYNQQISNNNQSELMTENESQLRQFKGSPIEYYKTKCKVYRDKLQNCELELKKIKDDNEKLRNLNLDYVHQMNLISHEKLKGIEKIIITSDVFDVQNVEQESIKAFVRKLANNYKIQEREQKKLISHCKVMEADIEVYKTKMQDAEAILHTLKRTGETSVQGLLEKLKELTDNNIRLTQEKEELTLNNAILKENIEKQGRVLNDVETELGETKANLQDIKGRHNKLLLDKEDHDQNNQKVIYELKCKSDELEFQLRKYAQQLNILKNDRLQSEITNKELDTMNKTLMQTTTGFFNAKKYLATSKGFKFK